jgi:acetate kinase
VLAGLEDLGIAVDPQANVVTGAGEREIGAAAGRVKVWVIPTNEELIVARQTRDLLAGSSAGSPTGRTGG